MRDEVDVMVEAAALLLQPEEEPPSPPPPTSRAARLEEAPFVVVESGRIRFYARPRVEFHDAPARVSELKRLSFTLTPHIGSNSRRIAVGKKRMPDTKIRERQWAYVERVGSASHVVADLGPKTYMTKTRGVRRQAGAIEIACGRYAIASHRDHSHLLYEIEGQLEDGTRAMDLLLRNLNIGRSASYIVAVFNPEASAKRATRRTPRGVSPQHEEVDGGGAPFGEPSIYTDDLMDRFAKRRFAPLEPSFLDQEGTELVLISGSAPRPI